MQREAYGIGGGDELENVDNRDEFEMEAKVEQDLAQ